ncbi:hypothetical protein HPP92_026349 [Vanilla planifolia]|uniref:At1g04390 ARM repeat domain-containing protein n=1 Tax=Vanilla planifolia TaxID=51239 RepID=A0A835PHL1_VANPL|nr:hypothetical protein HPP92_026349 [Vanilla planifolia]
MGSSREGRKKKCELSDYVFKLRQRLQDALSLGIRLFDDKVKRWECADAEIQSHALRTMVAFIECISSSHLQHPVIQESTKDMLVALGGILQSENERILSLALTVVMNLVNRLGNYIRQYHIVEVVFSLSRLLPLSPSISVIACGVLNRILTNLGSMRTERSMKVWNALEDANTVGYISLSLLDYMFTTSSSEYFTEMASLLHTILWKWPPSRFSIWGNKTLMTKLGERLSDSDPTILICVLRLCSALALCGNGATKLLENEVILLKTSGALESSQVLDVRVEATKFFQLLLRSQEGCSQLASTHIYSIFRGMIAGMSEYRSSGSIKVLNGQFLLAKVACQTALTTCRAGCYHPKLWDLGIDSILLDVLVGNKNMHLYDQLEDQLEVVMTEIWDLNREIRCNVWDILGCLAVNCAQDFPQTAKGKTGCLHALINIACSVAHELLCRGDLHEVEPVLRTVLLMVFSPCKHISIQARTCMSKLVRSCGKEYLGKLLASLQLISKGISLQFLIVFKLYST